MATTLKQTEGVVAASAWPTPPLDMSANTFSILPSLIWPRIEAWVSRRWVSRSVVWIIEGPGDWVAPLSPATIAVVEVWQADAWQAVTLRPSPLGGYVLDSEGPYRFTGTVGAGPVPDDVTEAYRRLAEYMGDNAAPSMWKGRAGASSVNVDLGSIKQSFDRNPAWLARAMQNSGAADLLRPYRGVA